MKKLNNFTQFIQPMKEEHFYHIFNQGNDRIKIFRCEENKNYFARQLEKYISPFADIVCKCLMNNHFHILLRVKPYEQMIPNIKKVKGLQKVIDRHKALGIRGEDSIVISEMLRRFFMSYSKAFNKMYNRTGSLFRKNFRRKLITSQEQLRTVLIYIHRNPVTHKMAKDFTSYKWSSYSNFIGGNIKNNFVKTVFEKIFGSTEEYIRAHIQCTINEEDSFVMIE